MKRGGFLVVLAVWLLAAGWPMLAARGQQSAAPPAAAAPLPVHAATIKQYCLTCHNQRTKSGELSLEGLDPTRVGDHPEVWEEVVRKLRARTMPPPGMPRPDEQTFEAVTARLESELDKAAALRPNPGRPIIGRLNRTEYANAIRDLLSLEVDASTLLPADDSAFGFDNISDLLGISPALLERYLVAADRISALAVGAPVAAGSDTYRIRQDRSQDQHIEGLPLGTVGGLAVKHVFPVDGEYEFSLELYRTNLEAIRGLEHPHQIEINIDGGRAFVMTIGGENSAAPQVGVQEGARAPVPAAPPAGGPPQSVTDRSDALDARLKVRVPVTAGAHTVGATFVRKIGAGTQRLRPFLRSSAGTYDSTGRPHIETLTIAGPFDAKGPGDTASRRRVFTCRPARAADEERCATEILSAVARRAFRRPLADADLERLRTFYRSGREKGSFDDGVQMGLRRILASPSFIFRVEEDAAPGATRRISDIELASRLSFFLWSSIPDDTLLDLAARNRLRAPGVLEAQVRRMLADPKSGALVRNFAGQWLHIRNLRNITPNHDEFPDFDDTLREAFQREMELFFESIMRDDRNVVDLLTADHTFVNERLAKHYGVPFVYGSHFRRVTLTDDARRGLFGKGSLLLVTSHADRTAPVLRGKWILENLLGTPPPPPPAGVPPLEGGVQARTLRERMEAHRASPACAGCHRVMDPLGFALENFDAVGSWRTRDGEQPIDASGQLADGTKVDGVVALREALLQRPDVFVSTFTQKMLTYGLGRGLQHYDMPAVRDIVRTASRQHYRFSSIVLGIVGSAPFQMRATVAGDARQQTAAAPAGRPVMTRTGAVSR